MRFLNDIRGLLTRRKPVVIDLDRGDDGDAAADAHVEPKAAPALPSLDGVIGHDRRGGNGFAAGNRLPPPPSPHVQEVVGLVRSISAHLQSQNERADRVIACLERLPQAIDAMPEINRQNARLLEVMTEQLGYAKRRDESLNQTLGGITAASSRQTDVLGLLQQQLDTNNRSADVLIDGLADLRDAVGQLAGAASRTTVVLSEMTNDGQQLENDLVATLSRAQRWMTWAAVGGFLAAAAASTMAVAAML